MRMRDFHIMSDETIKKCMYIKVLFLSLLKKYSHYSLGPKKQNEKNISFKSNFEMKHVVCI